jgi:hypothetical protein
MKVVDYYLSYLQDQHYIRGPRPGKKPAPTFAWELIHGKEYPGWRSGRAPDAEEKLYKGYYVDKHLKDKWLHDINRIKNVEIRSSCEGHGPPGEMKLDWPTYVGFRLASIIETIDKVKRVVKELNRDKNTRAGWDIGMAKRPRIICAAPLYYKCAKHNEWVRWWDTLASRINKAVNG